MSSTPLPRAVVEFTSGRSGTDRNDRAKAVEQRGWTKFSWQHSKRQAKWRPLVNVPLVICDRYIEPISDLHGVHWHGDFSAMAVCADAYGAVAPSLSLL